MSSEAPRAAFGDLVWITPKKGSKIYIPGTKTKIHVEGKALPWSIEWERCRLRGDVTATAIKAAKPAAKK